jgi:hypothetical protein
MCGQRVIDMDGAIGCGGDAGLVETESGDIGGAAGGEEDMVGLDRAAVVETQQAAVAARLDRRGAAARMQGDAVGRERGLGLAAEILVEAAQRQVGAVDEVHRRAEAGEDAGEFDGDVARADDRDMAGAVGQVEGVVGDDGELGAGDVERGGVAAGGDGDPLGGDALLADSQRVRVLEHGAGLEDGGAGIVEELAVDAVEPGDLAVLGGDEALPVVLSEMGLPAEAAGVLHAEAVFGGDDHQLLGHAADIDAGAAPEALLGDADAGAVAGRDPAEPGAGRAAADHEQVEIICHRRILSRTGRPRGAAGRSGRLCAWPAVR